MVVARCGDLLDLVVERAGMLVAQRRERMLDPLLLLEQRLAEMLGVDARHRLSFLPRSSPVAEARRRSISAGPIPVSSTIFSLPPWPETSVRAVRGSASVSARSRRTASLARPRSGASVTRTFQASPCRPTTAVRPAPGLTRKRRRVVSAVTRSVYVGLPLGSVRVGHAVPAAFLALVRAFVDRCRRLLRSGRLGRPERRERLFQLQPQPPRVLHEPIVLCERAPVDLACFGVGLAEDQLRLAARLVAGVGRGLLGGDECRPQERLELAVADEVGL